MTPLEIFGIIGIVLTVILVAVIIGFIIDYFINLKETIVILEKRIRKLEQEVYSNENSS